MPADSPANQMRVMLAHLRASGVPFERAREIAWERIRWPHDTTHRWEWKALLGDYQAAAMVGMRVDQVADQIEAWRRAYEGEHAPEARPMGQLLAAA